MALLTLVLNEAEAAILPNVVDLYFSALRYEHLIHLKISRIPHSECNKRWVSLALLRSQWFFVHSILDFCPLHGRREHELLIYKADLWLLLLLLIAIALSLLVLLLCMVALLFTLRSILIS